MFLAATRSTSAIASPLSSNRAGSKRNNLHKVCSDQTDWAAVLGGLLLQVIKALPPNQFVIVYRVDGAVEKFKLDKSCPFGYVSMDESGRIPPS